MTQQTPEAKPLPPKRKSALESVITGTIEAPPRIMVFGTPGVGKSTLACSAPGAIVVQGEEGTKRIKTSRFPKPGAWPEVLSEQIQSLIDDPHDYRTLVVDTLDGLEALVFADVCRESKNCDSIDVACGGYGKGYNRAVDKWREMLSKLERLQAHRGMAVVLTAHSVVKTFHNPEAADYDRYIPKMNEKAWGVFYEWCDAVLFAQYETHAIGGAKLDDKAKAISTGVRVLRTTRKAAWEAKNRYGFPETIPLPLENGWSVIAQYLEAPKRLRAEIEALIAKADVALATSVRDWLAGVGENATELQEGLNRIKERLTTNNN